MKKNIIKNIFVLTLSFIIILFFINKITMYTSIKDIKDDKYYIMGNDKIPSIYNIVGERNLFKYKSYTKNDIETKIYKFKDIKNTKSDLSKYVQELKNNYNYIYTSDIDLSKDNTTISLSTNSTEDGKIIIIEIKYTNNNYEINISKGKGTIKVFE